MMHLNERKKHCEQMMSSKWMKKKEKIFNDAIDEYFDLTPSLEKQATLSWQIWTYRLSNVITVSIAKQVKTDEKLSVIILMRHCDSAQECVREFEYSLFDSEQSECFDLGQMFTLIMDHMPLSQLSFAVASLV